MKRLFLILGVLLGVATMALPLSAYATNSPACWPVKLPVAISSGQPATYKISGTLCKPSRSTAQIDVLIAGATYDHLYWDWPQDAGRYSYVQKTLASGRATFNFDRLGTGNSSRPPSTLVTLDTDTYILHQIIQWLRSPANGFSGITSVGHSLGSAVAAEEAAKYHDTDRLVLTGALHMQGNGLAELLASLYPASLDPQFSGRAIDTGYLTTKPGTRGVFYDLATANPAVISYDEAHKSVVSSTELAAAGAAFLLPASSNNSRNITVPILTIAGQNDKLICTGASVDCTNMTAVQNNEQPYYPSASSLTALTIPQTGHDLTLHKSADTSYRIIDQWIHAH